MWAISYALCRRLTIESSTKDDISIAAIRSVVWAVCAAIIDSNLVWLRTLSKHCPLVASFQQLLEFLLTSYTVYHIILKITTSLLVIRIEGRKLSYSFKCNPLHMKRCSWRRKGSLFPPIFVINFYSSPVYKTLSQLFSTTDFWYLNPNLSRRAFRVIFVAIKSSCSKILRTLCYRKFWEVISRQLYCE